MVNMFRVQLVLFTNITFLHRSPVVPETGTIWPATEKGQKYKEIEQLIPGKKEYFYEMKGCINGYMSFK